MILSKMKKYLKTVLLKTTNLFHESLILTRFNGTEITAGYSLAQSWQLKKKILVKILLILLKILTVKESQNDTLEKQKHEAVLQKLKYNSMKITYSLVKMWWWFEQKCRRDVIKILSNIKLSFPSKRILLYTRSFYLWSMRTMVTTVSRSCRCSRMNTWKIFTMERLAPNLLHSVHNEKPHLRIQDFTLLC